jgi:hypothetical protein
VDSEILSRYTIDPPEEGTCEGADGNPAARTVQDEGEQIIRLLSRFFLICCNPHQICRNFMSSSLMKTTMGPWLPSLYRTKVSFFYLCFFIVITRPARNLRRVHRRRRRNRYIHFLFIFYAVLMAGLEEILMVEFTDDEGDELF